MKALLTPTKPRFGLSGGFYPKSFLFGISVSGSRKWNDLLILVCIPMWRFAYRFWPRGYWK